MSIDAPGAPTARPLAAPPGAKPGRVWPWRRWFNRLAHGGDHAVTAVMLGERCVLARLEAPAAGSRPILAAAAEGTVHDLRRWREDGLFRRSLTLLVLPTEERQLLTLDRPEVPEAELALAVRWPLAEAMEADADTLLTTAQSMPAINDNQRPQVLAVASRLSVVRQHLATLRGAGIAARSIDVVDSALRGMALLQASEGTGKVDESSSGRVVLAFLGNTMGIGLVWRGAFCALRTLALPKRAPRDESEFEDHLALHIQRTADQFERQATRMAVRQVLACMPSLAEAARESVRNALPLEASLFTLDAVMDMGGSTRERCENDNTLTALACVAAARLFDLGRMPGVPGALSKHADSPTANPPLGTGGPAPAAPASAVEPGPRPGQGGLPELTLEARP